MLTYSSTKFIFSAIDKGHYKLKGKILRIPLSEILAHLIIARHSKSHGAFPEK